MKRKESLLSRIKRIFNLGINDDKAWDSSLWRLAGSQSLSGEIVTEDTALTYSAVWNAVNLIAGTVGSLPLHLMQKKYKFKRQATDKALYRVMHDYWNPYMTAMTGREVTMAHLLTHGNLYAEKIINTYGEVTELWPITPDRVKMKSEGKEIVYVIRVDKGEITLPYERVLHVPGLGFDGYQGYGIVAMARRSIGLGMAMESYGSLYFKNGTHPGIVVSHPTHVEDPKALREALEATYSGLGNANRMMLLEESMKVEKIEFSPEDSQFLESRQFQIPEIARWFNLPPHKLKDLSKSSFNNIEQEQISFVTDSILPWLIRLEQTYNQQLLTPHEQAKGFYHKHNVEGLLRGDAKNRAEYYKIMVDIGAMTRNEVREKEDLDPSDEPFADELFVMMNTLPLSQFQKYIDRRMTEPKIQEEPEEVEEETNVKQKHLPATELISIAYSK
jgi:HK97 family phage portal protein